MWKTKDTLKFGLDFILKLKPCSWNWKEFQGFDKKVHFGLIAQDVDKLASIKEYGFVDKKDGWFALNYWEFIGPLIKSCQELNQKNVELEKRITKLEKNEKSTWTWSH